MKARNLLIISPKTYNYHKLILKASQGLGFNSIWIEDRPYESLMFKIVSRYFNYFARLISIGFYKKCLDHFTANNIYFDTLIVVKGESVHPKVIEHIKLKFPKIRMIFYYWDSVKNVPNPFLITRYFEKCATFDIHDSENRCWDYIPLFAGNFSKNIKTKSRTKKLISFVGVFHSDRLKIIGDLISSYGKAKYSIKNQNIINLDKETDLFLYLYFPSIFHKIKALFKNPIYFFKLRIFFKGSPLNPKKMNSIYKKSDALLDINHPSQLGFTMRTYESLYSQKKLITTNHFIKNSPHFNDSRVQIISRKKGHIDKEFLKKKFIPLTKSESNSLTASAWLKNILK